MANAFDPYREALVVETSTTWAADTENLALTDQQRCEIAARLHARPEEATELEYLRLTVGFCRRITVTAADVERFGAAKGSPQPSSLPSLNTNRSEPASI